MRYSKKCRTSHSTKTSNAAWMIFFVSFSTKLNAAMYKTTLNMLFIGTLSLFYDLWIVYPQKYGSCMPDFAHFPAYFSGKLFRPECRIEKKAWTQSNVILSLAKTN